MIIKGGNVVFRDGVRVADVRVADGKIVEIAPALAAQAGEEIIDATGLHVFPGLIDMHVHSLSTRSRIYQSASRIRGNDGRGASRQGY